MFYFVSFRKRPTFAIVGDISERNVKLFEWQCKPTSESNFIRTTFTKRFVTDRSLPKGLKLLALISLPGNSSTKLKRAHGKGPWFSERSFEILRLSPHLSCSRFGLIGQNFIDMCNHQLKQSVIPT